MGVLRRKDLGQFLRYILVGTWNTAFGYGLFSLLNFAFSHRFTYGYVAAAAIGNFISVTVAFFGYKFFVFRTKGDYLGEYLRVWAVYGAAILANLLLLPVLVEFLKINSYAAQALLTVVTVLISFIGHKRFSFGRHGTASSDRDIRDKPGRLN